MTTPTENAVVYGLLVCIVGACVMMVARFIRWITRQGE
jgi:hypothetical protein